ncbi:MAG TPA: FG-GAP-like repeat-containing protein [Gemmatimonadaceae bacterium]|nr:FG-GAP-like repeat-containing protein [Gemmatimonadaceae bacterium]
MSRDEKRRATLIVVITLAGAVGVYGQGPGTFKPTAAVPAANLSGWHQLGDATWKVDRGEFVGTPAGDGGWLVLDKGLQDLQYYSNFKCAPGCKTGVLLRASKTPDGGLTGVFVSLNEGDLASYRLTLDATGKETAREKLTAAGRGSGGERGAAPGPARGGAAAPAPGAPAGRGEGRGGEGRGGGGLKPADWNSLEITLATDPRGDATDSVLTAGLNGRGGIAGGPAGGDGYGAVALFAGGTGEVRFKDIAYKDLHDVIEPKEVVSPNYTMQRLSDYYYAWCAGVGDFNHDGVADIEAGPYYYLGPDFVERRRYRNGRIYNGSTEYSPDMVSFAGDFTGDGWDDVLTSDLVNGRPIDLHVNPHGESRKWDTYRVIPGISTEIVLMKDMDGDGKPEILFGGNGVIAYAKPDPAKPTEPWVIRTISERGGRVNIHGLGAGDINGDGRIDAVVPGGWYEQPPKGTAADSPWTFHADNFGPGAAEIAVYDVNGDGLNDLVTGLAAHGFGLSWFEQKRDASKAITFVEHKIMTDFSTKNAGDVTFTEPHGSTSADMDGDGIPDFVVGKRFWSHLENYNGPDPYGPAVLYVYRTVRNPKAEGGAEFVPELIHNRSGVGSAFQVADLNKDGALDIVTSGNRGTFVFFGKASAQKKRAAGRR